MLRVNMSINILAMVHQPPAETSEAIDDSNDSNQTAAMEPDVSS